jgi:hypothetical protein
MIPLSIAIYIEDEVAMDILLSKHADEQMAFSNKEKYGTEYAIEACWKYPFTPFKTTTAMKKLLQASGDEHNKLLTGSLGETICQNVVVDDNYNNTVDFITTLQTKLDFCECSWNLLTEVLANDFDNYYWRLLNYILEQEYAEDLFNHEPYVLDEAVWHNKNVKPLRHLLETGWASPEHLASALDVALENELENAAILLIAAGARCSGDMQLLQRLAKLALDDKLLHNAMDKFARYVRESAEPLEVKEPGPFEYKPSFLQLSSLWATAMSNRLGQQLSDAITSKDAGMLKSLLPEKSPSTKSVALGYAALIKWDEGLNILIAVGAQLYEDELGIPPTPVMISRVQQVHAENAKLAEMYRVLAEMGVIEKINIK